MTIHRRSPESFGEQFAQAYSDQLAKIGALEEVFGTAGSVYIVGYRDGERVCQDIFPSKIALFGVDLGLQDAKDTFEDTEEPGYAQNIYRGCIVLNPDHTWKEVRLF